MTTTGTAPARRGAIRRYLSAAGALACFAAAVWVLLSAGLPDRTAAAALYLLPDGRTVAPEPGAIAPPITLVDIDGERHTLAALRGQVVVVNFWATWCGPCRLEMPALQALADRHSGRISVLGVNTGEPAEAVAGWREEFGLTFPLLLDADCATARDYRLRGMPTTIIVTPGGTVHAVLYGPADVAALEQAAATLLADENEEDTP